MYIFVLYCTEKTSLTTGFSSKILKFSWGMGKPLQTPPQKTAHFVGLHNFWDQQNILGGSKYLTWLALWASYIYFLKSTPMLSFYLNFQYH